MGTSMSSDRGEYDITAGIDLRKSSLELQQLQQLELLRRHLVHSLQVPFYQKRLQFLKKEDIMALSWEELAAEIPFTTRTDIDNNRDQFSIGKPSSYVDISLTSGTTGEPLVVPYTSFDLHRLAYNEAMAFHSAGIGPGDSVLLTVTLDRCFVAGIAYYTGLTMLGAGAIRSGPGQPARQWQILNHLAPGAIVGVPSFLLELARWGEANGYDPRRGSVKKLITIGEAVRYSDNSHTSMGQELAAAWGAQLFSSYGATEFETAFGECQMGAGGHVHPELMHVEVVDKAGITVADGELGEVVVTPLGVEGFPMLRLRTGDMSRLHSTPCACGWQNPRIGPIEGRLAQRLKYKGTTLYPENIFHVLQKQDSVDNAYVEVLATDGCSDELRVVVGSREAEIGTYLQELLQATLRVKPPIIVNTPEQVRAKMHAGDARKAQKFFDYRNK